MSPYTVDIGRAIFIVDIPPNEDHRMGLTDKVRKRLDHRANVRVVEADITEGIESLSNLFDLALAVEIVEHIEEDKAFVRETFELLKPGGILFLTTPNGDARPVNRAYHRRHYTRDELDLLLRCCFEEVHVVWANMMRRKVLSLFKTICEIPLIGLIVQAWLTRGDDIVLDSPESAFSLAAWCRKTG